MREVLLVRMKKEASSELLAGLCRTAAMGFQGCCPFPRCECPLMCGTRCGDVTPGLWDEVFHRSPNEEDADAEEDHAEN